MVIEENLSNKTIIIIKVIAIWKESKKLITLSKVSMLFAIYFIVNAKNVKLK